MLKTKYTPEELKSLKTIHGVVGTVVIVGDNFYFKFPKRSHRLVYITSGTFYSNGRVSNHWEWQDVNPDGTLGKFNCGYGNFYQPKEKYKINIIIRRDV